MPEKMDPEKYKEFSKEIHEIEQKYGVRVVSFLSDKAREEAVENLALAKRFKDGLLTIPLQPLLPN